MSLKALAVGGHISPIGASLSPSGTMLDPLLLTGRGITVGAISVGSRADFEAMNRAIAMHRRSIAHEKEIPLPPRSRYSRSRTDSPVEVQGFELSVPPKAI